MDNYIKDLIHVIRQCDMENTYKMAWARSIVETCVLNPKIKEIHFDQLASLIFGYYWNQTIFFELQQGPNYQKKPEIHQMTLEKIDEYRSEYGYKPERYTKVEDKVSIVNREISTVLRKDVCWRFLEVGGQHYNFYNLDRDNRTIVVHQPALMREYADILFELINYRWTQKLEGFNDTPRISQKVRGTDRENIRRSFRRRFYR